MEEGRYSSHISATEVVSEVKEEPTNSQGITKGIESMKVGKMTFKERFSKQHKWDQVVLM